MPLKLYRQKRNFKKTPEPSGRRKLVSKNRYLIQKHAASHLHYDLRLELDGVLKSWAVPKGPSLDPHIKRLAVHVEDHPLEYGSFQGTIPKGEYGGGTVMLWDTGTWTEKKGISAQDAYKKGHLVFTIKGKKLKGLWQLIRLKADPKNWLFMKVNDDYASTKIDITKKEPLSVTTKQTMEEIALDLKASVNKKKMLKVNDSQKDKMPTSLSPELATLVDKPPTGDEWIHEIKFDGYRFLAFINQGKVRLITRNQNDWTNKFPHLVKSLAKLPVRNAILDGEVVAVDEKYRSNFQLLQNAIHKHTDAPLIYYLFDLLYFNDHNIMHEKLLERKMILHQILAKAQQANLQFSDHVKGNVKSIFKKTCQLGLEGLVSKKIDSPYVQKRTRQWLKSKCIKRQSFVICGFTKPRGTRSYFGALLLGVYNHKKLIYCGRVGTGFSEQALKTIAQQLHKLVTTTSPFHSPPSDSKSVTWVKPSLIAEVEFAEWTRDNILRAPRFMGLRDDKLLTKIIRQYPNKSKGDR